MYEWLIYGHITVTRGVWTWVLIVLYYLDTQEQMCFTNVTNGLVHKCDDLAIHAKI